MIRRRSAYCNTIPQSSVQLMHHFPFVENADDVVGGIVLNNSNVTFSADDGACFNGINAELTNSTAEITAIKFPKGIIFEFDLWIAPGCPKYGAPFCTYAALGTHLNDLGLSFSMGFHNLDKNPPFNLTIGMEVNNYGGHLLGYMLELGVWQRIKVVFDVDKLDLFVDGEEQTELFTHTIPYNYSALRQKGLRFGRIMWTSSGNQHRWFSGYIKDFKIYKII